MTCFADAVSGSSRDTPTVSLAAFRSSQLTERLRYYVDGKLGASKTNSDVDRSITAIDLAHVLS
jgi:hypothetical protein